MFSKTETDLLTAFRKGENIEELIKQNIGAKMEALGGQFTSNIEEVDSEHISNRSMINIGG